MLICCISHHLITSSIPATKQKHPNCRYAVRVPFKKKRAMFILGLIVAWCHVLADGCDKERTLLEYHP